MVKKKKKKWKKEVAIVVQRCFAGELCDGSSWPGKETTYMRNTLESLSFAQWRRGPRRTMIKLI